MEKLKIKEAVVVEGRDDTIAVKKAAEALTIETHGFGIKKETWKLIEKAYENQGIIIFTDPDYSGEEIRRKLTDKFPEAKQAFLTRSEAIKKGDVGIENAKPEAIAEALRKAHCTASRGEKVFTEEDLYKAGLSGRTDSKEKRGKLGLRLGIGGGNGRAFLNKLNSFGITEEEFEAALKKID
ncbi:MAG: ribonuclease M5 [Anaerovoracaceae bacterium]|nr:ribonuclease M5 [Anaerovoracaceae bacterium]